MGSETQWRGQSDTTFGRLRWGFLASVVLHLPFTPLMALLGLLALLSKTEPPAPPLPPLTGIPVDLLEGEEAETPPPAVTPPPAPEPAVVVEPVVPKHHEPSEPKIRDAGASDAEPSDAASDAEADAGSEGNDAGLDGGITDPVAASGTEKISDVNANVQLLVFTEKLRGHPLAPRLSRALSSIYQWRDFFGPTGLDPVTDVDRLLVWGPQLRDSSEVGVVAKLNAPPERIRGAIDGIVAADPESGAWLDAGVPAATARVDRAPRVFILPSPRIVIVVPPTAAEKALKVGKKFTLPGAKGDEVATAKLATPWRAFRGTGIPLEIPKSILWARAKASLGENGSVIIEIVAKDESPEKAAESAAYLEKNVTALSQIDLGILGALLGTGGSHKFAEKILFTSQGDEIHGAILLTQRQLAEIMDFALAFLAPGPRRRGPRPQVSTTPPGRQQPPESPTYRAPARPAPGATAPAPETPSGQAPAPTPGPPSDPAPSMPP